MTARKALIQIDGQLMELPEGDTLTGAGSRVTVSTTAPELASGVFWFDLNADTLYLCVDDGAGGLEWVEPGAAGAIRPQNLFLQPTQPVMAPGMSFLWIETALPNNGMTFWIEDGL